MLSLRSSHPSSHLLHLLLLSIVVLASNGEESGGVVVRAAYHGRAQPNPVLDVGLVDPASDVILKDLTGWEGWDGMSEVLLKCVVGELKALLRAVRPKVPVHRAMDWLPILVEPSAPGIVPKTSPVVTLFETNCVGGGRNRRGGY